LISRNWPGLHHCGDWHSSSKTIGQLFRKKGKVAGRLEIYRYRQKLSSICGIYSICQKNFSQVFPGYPCYSLIRGQLLEGFNYI
jgi:hypothetical protein